MTNFTDFSLFSSVVAGHSMAGVFYFMWLILCLLQSSACMVVGNINVTQDLSILIASKENHLHGNISDQISDSVRMERQFSPFRLTPAALLIPAIPTLLGK